MQTLRQDIQFGLRMFIGNPRFTGMAVLMLALGIAANTTVFSWVNGVLLHPFPGAGEPQNLVLIETVTPSGEFLVNTSYLDYRDYRDNLKLASGVAVARFTPLSVGENGRTERAWAELVSANYFEVLQVKPVLGRAFLPEEGGDQPGAYPVAVVSNQMWRNHYHSDPKVLGKTIRLNRHELTIVGVAPAGFHGSIAGVVFDVWMPVTMATAMGTGGGTLNFRGTRDLTSTIARLRPGVGLQQFRAEAGALAKRLAAIYPATNRAVDATVVPVWAGHLGAQGLLLKPLRLLMAVCALLLLIVCANVANMLLSRAVSRQKEFGIRLALGAPRSRLVRQLITETLMLAGAGALAGLLMVLWLGPSLLSLIPANDVPLDLGGGLNLPTLGFTVLIVVTATVMSGLAPALLSVRVDLNQTLKEGGRGGTLGSRSHRLRGMLVGAEVALAMVALAGAGLFYRSFRNASGIEPGFDMTNVSVTQFYLSNAGYSAAEQRSFCRNLRERLETAPGVLGVTYSDVVPLTSAVASSPWHQVEIDGYIPAPNEQMIIHRATVPPGYFQFMSIPLREGREFTESDDAAAPPVMIVNETFAQRFFGSANPIERKVRMEGRQTMVIALAKDSKYHTAIEARTPFFYVPFQQVFAPGLNFSIFIRTTGDPLRMIPTLRREALALNQDAVFTSNRLADAATASLYPQKVAASLLSVVGAICLLLAGTGLYSVMSYALSQRTRELGIRMALGARPADVLMMVVREGLSLTIPGLLAGTAAALAASRLIGGMLVGVNAADPLTFAGAGLFLAAVSMVAGYLPGLRATRVDPITALRCD